MISSRRSRFCRCTTAFTVSGSPASRTRPRSAALRLLRSGKTGDPVAGCDIGILQAQLHMLEPGAHKRLQPFGIEANARSDQVAVKPDLGRVVDEFDEVTSHEGLPPGEMHLQNPERRGLAENLASKSRCRVRRWRLRAPADSSNRDSAAGSDASVPPGARAAARWPITGAALSCRRGPSASRRHRRRSPRAARRSARQALSTTLSTSRLPSISRRISTACSSGSSSRSGASTTQA